MIRCRVSSRAVIRCRVSSRAVIRCSVSSRAVIRCRVSSRAVMDEKPLSLLFPGGWGCILLSVTGITGRWANDYLKAKLKKSFKMNQT